MNEAQGAGTPITFNTGQKVGGGRFTLVRQLGRGGMGVVWLAMDERLNEEVALKALPPEIAADAMALDDLRRETKKTRRLSHPNIVRIHDLYEAPGESAFISMEYVEGLDLTTLRVKEPQRCFSWEFVAPLAVQLCEALEYAHGEKVVHRDLKPANLILDNKGRLKLADFGISGSISDSVSRISARFSTSGTLAYMSPQQMNGERPRVTDDIYSLGATLYELLTSRPPFNGANIPYQVLNLPAQPLTDRLAEFEITNEVPGWVGALIMSCLAKYAKDRPQSARAITDWLGGRMPQEEVARRLSRVDSEEKAQEPAAAEESAAAEEPIGAGEEKPRKFGLIIGGIALLALLATGGAWYWSGHRGIQNVPDVKKPEATRPWQNSIGMQFVSVPGTRVLFSIWDTRVQDFEVFVKDTGYDATAGMWSLKSDGWKQRGDSWQSPGFAQGPTFPVCGVSWEDGHAFCAWLTKKEQQEGKITSEQSYRLPTDAEWSAAAGDGLYPWGNQWQWPPPASAGNYAGTEVADGSWPSEYTWIAAYRDGYARTSPVGSFGANRYGLYDMGGNLWQWCEEWYRKEMNSEEIRMENPALNDDGGGQEYRLLRGASWFNYTPLYLRSGYRFSYFPGYRISICGFRCVLEYGEVAPYATGAAEQSPVASAPSAAGNTQNEESRMEAPESTATVPPATAPQLLPGSPLIRDGLVLYFSFDEPPLNGVVPDESGTGNAGRVVNAQWTAQGRHGGAMRFFRSNSYITVPNRPALNPAQITVAAWIRTSYSDNQWLRIFDKSYSKGFALSVGGDFGRWHSQGQLVWEAGAHSTESQQLRIDDGRWHQVAGTYDGEMQRLYLDGELLGKETRWQGRIATNSYDLTIGANHSTLDNNDQISASFGGLIDEVMIFNRALSPYEIQQLYDSVPAESKESAQATPNSEWITLFGGNSAAAWVGSNSSVFPSRSWKVEDGVLKNIPEGPKIDLYTREKFRDFELEFEWRIGYGGNSGVLYGGGALPREFQLIDEYREHFPIGDRQAFHEEDTGALWGVIAPSDIQMLWPQGEWNQGRLLVKGTHVEHWVNGHKVVEYELGSAELARKMANSPSRYFKDHHDAEFSQPDDMPIRLQSNRGEVWFRNILVRRLNASLRAAQ